MNDDIRWAFELAWKYYDSRIGEVDDDAYDRLQDAEGQVRLAFKQRDQLRAFVEYVAECGNSLSLGWQARNELEAL